MKLHRLSIGYSSGKVVARGLTAVAPHGALTLLLGRNGCGKSTLLRTLAGLLRPLDGTVTPAPTPTGVSIVTTAPIAAPALRVRDLVGLGRLPHTGLTARLTPADYEAISRAMTDCDLTALADREVATLSDGERQRALMARALAQDTPYILLDEPTAFLDYPGKAAAYRLFRRLCREESKTIIVSTHDLDLALRYADHVWYMHNGTLSEGAPDDVQMI